MTEEHYKILTGETRGHKHLCETAKATDEGRVVDVPVVSTDIMVAAVDTNIDKNTDDDKYHDRGDFQGGKPVFCERKE